jgi:hypothetical protein
MLFAGNSLRPGPPLKGPVSIRFERFTVFQASGSAGGWVTLKSFFGSFSGLRRRNIIMNGTISIKGGLLIVGRPQKRYGEI